ncbi:RNA polymerase sigma factor SigK [compost metagenome]
MDSTSLGNENDLLARIASGDEFAFKIIYNRYRPKVFSYALKYLKSESESEEILQEVFLKLWIREVFMIFLFKD